MIAYAQVSQKGDRDYNEDRTGLGKAKGRYIFGLADGLGGHGHGDVASGIAVEAVTASAGAADLQSSLAECFEKAQEQVMLRKKEDVECAGMMTTLTALELRKGEIGWGHIGDSRIYYFQDGKLSSHTLDHSVPQMLVQMGEIQESEIRHHPDRNRLLRSIGMEWDRKLYKIDETIERRGKQQFLLCSDGFWEYIEETVMERLLQKAWTPKQWLRQMEKEVLKNGREYDMDNYSAIAIWSKSKA